LTFLKKINKTDPLIDAKFKSKTHLLFPFLVWPHFLRALLQSWKKYEYELHADFKSVENFFQNA
jgi:hypothetical protein